MAKKTRTSRIPNPKSEKMRFAAVPEIKCLYEKLGKQYAVTQTQLFEEATALLIKKYGARYPSREEVAAWFGPGWVSENQYKVKAA